MSYVTVLTVKEKGQKLLGAFKLLESRKCGSYLGIHVRKPTTLKYSSQLASQSPDPRMPDANPTQIHALLQLQKTLWIMVH